MLVFDILSTICPKLELNFCDTREWQDKSRGFAKNVTNLITLYGCFHYEKRILYLLTFYFSCFIFNL